MPVIVTALDNVTHTLFALTLARTPLGRAGRGTTAALVLASNAPDIDIVAAVRGGDNYLTWHRGPTHGLLGIIGLGLLAAGLARVGLQFTRQSPDEEPDASFGLLAAIGMMGVLFHVLMDLPTSYGTRLLSPFDWHWFAIDWMPIVDIYLLAILAAGLAFGRQWTLKGPLSVPHVGLSGTRSTSQRRNAAIVLVLMTANYGVRAAAHHEALANATRLFGPILPERCDAAATNSAVINYWPHTVASAAGEPDRRCLVDIAAVPTFISPFRWRVIAHLSNAYAIHDIDLLDARFRQPPSESEVMYRTTLRVPNVWTPPVFAAATTRQGRAFLGFARFPAARGFIDPTGTATVRWTEMRFVGGPPTLDRSGRPNDPFGVVVRIAPDGRVLDEQLGR